MFLLACIASCNLIICRSFEVEVKAPKGKVYSLVISDLFEPIVPADSSVKVRGLLANGCQLSLICGK